MSWRRMGLVAWLLLAGCATARPTTTGGGDDVRTAQRLYTEGEQRFAAGRADQAVLLWRHAITQLPETSSYDALRHRLLLRLGRGQLVAFQQRGKLAHLYDGKRMLERYLAKHEALFGDGPEARRQRGEVYDLLGDLEASIEAPGKQVLVRGPATPAAPAPTSHEPLGSYAAVAAAPLDRYGLGSTPPDPAAARAAHDGTARGRRRAQRPWYEHPDDMQRVVEVDGRKPRPSNDDWNLRMRLKLWNPNAGLSLTAPRLTVASPARPLVRIDGLAQIVDGGAGRLEADAQARRFIRAVRPDLRACYGDAYARSAKEVTTATVEFTMRADGSVARPRIVAGDVADAFGDACVLERLAAARIEPDTELAEARVRVPLMFFYDRTVPFDENTGLTVQTGWLVSTRSRALDRGIPRDFEERTVMPLGPDESGSPAAAPNF